VTVKEKSFLFESILTDVFGFAQPFKFYLIVERSRNIGGFNIYFFRKNITVVERSRNERALSQIKIC